MEIFELAKLLGEAIKKDVRLIEFEEAKNLIASHGFDTLYYLTKDGFTEEKIR